MSEPRRESSSASLRRLAAALILVLSTAAIAGGLLNRDLSDGKGTAQAPWDDAIESVGDADSSPTGRRAALARIAHFGRDATRALVSAANQPELADEVRSHLDWLTRAVGGEVSSSEFRVQEQIDEMIAVLGDLTVETEQRCAALQSVATVARAAATVLVRARADPDLESDASSHLRWIERALGMPGKG